MSALWRLAGRPGLAWAPPFLIAVVIVAVLQLGLSGGDEDAPAPSSSITTPSTAATTATTGFALRTPTLPNTPFDYATELPAHVESEALGAPLHQPLSALDTAVGAAEITDEGATLGRVLFYDVNLSANRTVRCASCHAQANSFTDPLMRSQGFRGGRTRRNSMSLANARFNASGRFLWDERAPTLEDQVLMPFFDVLEMGLTGETLLARIDERDFYGPLFVDAFGDDEVSLDRVSRALAQFIRSLVSLQSRYDEGRAQVGSPGEPFPNFTDAENEGRELFFTPVADGGGGCSSCHTSEAQLTSPIGLSNNGLDPPTAELVVPDIGAYEVTGKPEDVGRFRVPSLRNVEVTGPYMHDGRLADLDAVVEHYNSQIQPHQSLGEPLRDGAGDPVRLGFDEDQKAALVAFLGTFTDAAFLRDERFSEPFRAP